MSDLRDELREQFESFTGRSADGLWSAPGRVALFGEHTVHGGGSAMAFAIDRRTLVALGARDDGMLRVASAFDDEVVEVPLADLAAARFGGAGGAHLDGWSAYPLGVAWALGEFGADLRAVPGADILIDSNVPVGAGLSSSAAIESAVALALTEVWQLGLSRETLAKVGQRAENDVVGASGGIMGQSASLLGRADSAVFLDGRSLATELVPLGFDAAGLTIVVIDTGVTHELDRARVRNVATENQRVLDAVALLRAGKPAEIGELLDASHRWLRDDVEVSVPELDLAVETAIDNGALGARMTGGSFGGTAIALVPIDGVSRIQVALDGAFAEHGFASPTAFTVRASEGAKREP